MTASDNAAFDVHSTDPARLSSQVKLRPGYVAYQDNTGKWRVKTPDGHDVGPFKDIASAKQHFELSEEVKKDLGA